MLPADAHADSQFTRFQGHTRDQQRMLQPGTNACTFLGMNPHQSGLLGQPLDSSAASPSGVGQSWHRDTSGRTFEGTHSHQSSQHPASSSHGASSYTRVSRLQVSHLDSSAVSSSSGGICAQKGAHSAVEGAGSARKIAAARKSAVMEGTKMRHMVLCVSCVS